MIKIYFVIGELLIRIEGVDDYCSGLMTHICAWDKINYDDVIVVEIYLGKFFNQMKISNKL